MNNIGFTAENNELALNLPGRVSRPEVALVAAVAAVSAARVISPGIRNVLPEPVDVPDHIGNLGPTLAYTSAVSLGFWRAKGKDIYAETEEVNKRDRKVFATIIGATTVGMNVLAEKIGYGTLSTPDYLDFAYGCLGGYLAYKISAPRTISPEDVSQIYINSVKGDGADAEKIEHAVAKWQEKKAEKAVTPSLSYTSAKMTKSAVHGTQTRRANRTRHNKHQATKKARKNNRKRK